MQPRTTSIIALATVAACASGHEPISRQRVELRAAASSAPPPARKERGPDAFEQLLARWEEMPDGKAKQALAAEVDRAAGQRYATVSRLYWHTDLDAAL